MNKALEIEKAEKDLKEANDKLHIFNAHVHKLQTELFILRTVEKNILENVQVLKHEAPIIMALEFLKAKKDLEECQRRISFLNIDLSNHERVLHKIEKRVIECKEEYAKALLIPLAKIIIGRFGKRDGQD